MVDQSVIDDYQQNQKEPQKVPSSTAPLERGSSTKSTVILLVVALLVFGSFYFIGQQRRLIEAPESTTFRVGNDFYSKADISQVASLHFAGKTYEELLPQDRFVVHDIIYRQASALQEAKREGIVTYERTLLDPDKDWMEYNQKVQEIQAKFIDDEARITLGGLILYFHNQGEPAMGVEVAKKITLEKMQNYRQRILSGEIDFEDAHQEIVEDTSQSEVDESYLLHPVSLLQNKRRSEDLFSNLLDAEEDLLWSLKKGEISPVIKGYQKERADLDPREAFWAVYTVLDKSGEGGNYEGWVDSIIGHYELHAI